MKAGDRRHTLGGMIKKGGPRSQKSTRVKGRRFVLVTKRKGHVKTKGGQKNTEMVGVSKRWGKAWGEKSAGHHVQ